MSTAPIAVMPEVEGSPEYKRASGYQRQKAKVQRVIERLNTALKENAELRHEIELLKAGPDCMGAQGGEEGRVPQWRLDEVTRARREAERQVKALENRVEELEEALSDIWCRLKEKRYA